MATNKTAETLKALLAAIDAMRAGGSATAFGPFDDGTFIDWPNLALLAKEAEATLANVAPADFIRCDGQSVVIRMPSHDEANRLAMIVRMAAERHREDGGQLTGALLGILRDRAAIAESVAVI